MSIVRRVQPQALINNTDYRYIRADSATHTLQAIDYAHHEVHAGSHFMYSDAVELASGAAQYYLITTPDTTKWAHIGYELGGSVITQFEIYEGTDKTGTSLQTVFNNDRNSGKTATTTIHKGVSGGTTDGALIHLHKGGSSTGSTREGVSSGSGEEIILKQNTKYILRITSGTNGNLTNVILEWYEHTNKV